MDNFKTKFATPLHIHTDQVRNFKSDIFKEHCSILGIDKTRTKFKAIIYGGVEQFYTLAIILTMYCEQNQNQWDRYLQQIMVAYCSSVRVSTWRTPKCLVFDREITLPPQSLIRDNRKGYLILWTSSGLHQSVEKQIGTNLLSWQEITQPSSCLSKEEIWIKS